MATIKLQSEWLKANYTEELSEVSSKAHSRTYLFKDPKNGAQKVLKVWLRDGKDTSAEWKSQVKLFMTRLEKLKTSKHIIPILDVHVDENEERVFVITEMAEYNLSSYITSKSKLKSETILELLRSLYEALKFERDIYIYRAYLDIDDILIVNEKLMLTPFKIYKNFKKYKKKSDLIGAIGDLTYWHEDIIRLRAQNELNDFQNTIFYSIALITMVACGFDEEAFDYSLNKWRSNEQFKAILRICNNLSKKRKIFKRFILVISQTKAWTEFEAELRGISDYLTPFEELNWDKELSEDALYLINKGGYSRIFEKTKEQLESNKSNTCLDLDLFNIRHLNDETIVYLCKIIKDYQNLEKAVLGLHMTCIGDLGVKYLLSALKPSQNSLKELGLFASESSITDKGFEIFASALPEFKQLEVVNFGFSKTKITEFGLASFLKALDNLEKVRRFNIDLSDVTHLSEDIIQELISHPVIKNSEQTYINLKGLRFVFNEEIAKMITDLSSKGIKNIIIEKSY